jgi:ribokinase
VLREKPFLGCGALNWDIFFGLEDLSAFSFEGFKFFPGEEYVFERKAFLELLEKLKKEATFLHEGGGGSSANTLYALAKWGYPCIFIGAVGEDEFGKKILEEFKEVGLNRDNIFKSNETSLALILLDKKRDRSIVVSPGSAEASLSLEKIKLPSMKEAWLHLSSFASKEGEAFQKGLISTFKGVISLDPGEIYAEKGKEFLKPFLEKTKYLFMTERELELANLSCEELLKEKVHTIFIKMGKRGAMALSKNMALRYSVYPAKKIIDNTGAGDYFNAGVLAGLYLNFTLEKALELGLYSASLSLRDYGRRGVLNQEEFKKFLSRLKLEDDEKKSLC